MILIRNQQNIIISNIDFNRINYNPSNKSFGEKFDHECLGDIIGIYNFDDKHHSSRIWINRSTFRKCGDGCIDITRPTDKIGTFTVSYNKFVSTNKTMVIGGHYNYLDMSYV